MKIFESFKTINEKQRFTAGEEQIYDLRSTDVYQFVQKFSNDYDIFFTNHDTAHVTKRMSNIIYHGKPSKAYKFDYSDVKFVWAGPEGEFYDVNDFFKLLQSVHKGKRIKLNPINPVLFSTKFENVNEDSNIDLSDDEFVFARNQATFSWEYNYMSNTLNLVLNKETLEISAIVVKISKSTGIGRRTDVNVVDYKNLGTFNKPKLVEINKIKKLYNMESSRSTSPMKSNSWEVIVGNDVEEGLKLKDVFGNDKLLAKLKMSLFEYVQVVEDVSLKDSWFITVYDKPKTDKPKSVKFVGILKDKPVLTDNINLAYAFVSRIAAYKFEDKLTEEFFEDGWNYVEQFLKNTK